MGNDAPSGSSDPRIPFFGSSGRPLSRYALGDRPRSWQETRRIYAWQKVLGVDRFFTHGFWTSVDGITNYETPPDYGPNTSLFPGTAAVNEWLSRCDERLDGARPRVETAVVNNLLPFWVWGPGMTIGRRRRAFRITPPRKHSKASEDRCLLKARPTNPIFAIG